MLAALLDTLGLLGLLASVVAHCRMAVGSRTARPDIAPKVRAR